MIYLDVTLTFCRPCVPQTPSCRLLSTTPAIHYSHALRRVSCRYDVKWISCQVFTYRDVLDQLRNWQICGDYQCAKIINNLTDYLGIWPGCWWAGNESCGNHVTELHCCGRWKHSQVCVGLSNLKHVFFPTQLKLSFLCRTIDRSVFKPIVQISVIDRSESSDCHLLAVTHAGKDYRTVVTMTNNSRILIG